jgi:RAP1 GTPase activating protein 1
MSQVRFRFRFFVSFSNADDETDNETGLHSWASELHGHQIMFHASTELPHDNSDPQQIQKKRHIGNDIVCLVFKEDDTPFHPTFMRTCFTHYYLVVSPAGRHGNMPMFKINATAVNEIRHSLPAIPDPPVLRGDQLREFILTKRISLARSASFFVRS